MSSRENGPVRWCGTADWAGANDTMCREVLGGALHSGEPLKKEGGEDMEGKQMVRIIRVIAVVLVMLAWGLAGVAVAQEQSPLASPIIINHKCTDLPKVPDYWIKQAKKKLRVGYTHTSHGSQLVSGIEAFRGKRGSLYHYSASDWGAEPGVFLNDCWACEYASDLGGGGDLTWRDATVTMLGLAGNDRNVVMWSWCGGVSENTKEGINAYLKAMKNLEQSYPGIKFVYMTGHLDGSGATGNLTKRNNQIRSYCRKNNKILFDFADIESYAPKGSVNFMERMANDNCDYDSDGNGNLDRNWAADWIDGHPNSALARLAGKCGECEHSHQLNCVLKGRAFWWMMARLAGWDGSPVAAP